MSHTFDSSPTGDSLDTLNAAQREAVLHGLATPDHRALLIIAGAGSGKTSTLAQRVGQLIKHGADPNVSCC